MKASQRLRPEARRRLWRWVRPAAGAAILVVVVLRLGAGPFLDGLRGVQLSALTLAVGLTALTTLLSAWRWRLIARGLGLPIPLRAAVAAYYRSQFLNSTLPGGVVGDVHRGVRQGETVDDLSIGLRSVAWDRAAGQLVQVLLALVALVVLPSPVRAGLAVVAGIALAILVAVALILVTSGSTAYDAHGPLRRLQARMSGAVRRDFRAVLRIKHAGPAVVAASAAVVVGHVGVFLVAARAAGTSASVRTLLPIAMLVLLAMTVPTSIGGWGPREGVAAWAFAAAGLGAGQGVATATIYGVLSTAATLPGAIVLIRARRARAVMPVGPRGRQLVGSGSTMGPGWGGATHG